MSRNLIKINGGYFLRNDADELALLDTAGVNCSRGSEPIPIDWDYMAEHWFGQADFSALYRPGGDFALDFQNALLLEGARYSPAGNQPAFEVELTMGQVPIGRFNGESGLKGDWILDTGAMINLWFGDNMNSFDPEATRVTTIQTYAPILGENAHFGADLYACPGSPLRMMAYPVEERIVGLLREKGELLGGLTGLIGISFLERFSRVEFQESAGRVQFFR